MCALLLSSYKTYLNAARIVLNRAQDIQICGGYSGTPDVLRCRTRFLGSVWLWEGQLADRLGR